MELIINQFITLGACYGVLGIVHTMYKPMPGR